MEAYSDAHGHRPRVEEIAAWQSDVQWLVQCASCAVALIFTSGVLALSIRVHGFSNWALSIPIASSMMACLLQIQSVWKEWQLVRNVRFRVKPWLAELRMEEGMPLRSIAWGGIWIFPFFSGWMTLLTAVILLNVVMMLILGFLEHGLGGVAGVLLLIQAFFLAMQSYMKLRTYRKLLTVLEESRHWRRIRKLEV